MIDPNADIRFGYTIFAALSGAITSLAFVKWKEMDFISICLTVFMSFTFSIYAAPYFAHLFFGINDNDPRAMQMVTYVSAIGAQSFLPAIILWARKKIGGGE